MKPLNKSLLTSAFLAIASISAGNAATITWGNTGGNAWLTTTNWAGNVVPGTTDIAEFDANPTGAGSNSGVGLNFANAVNNGTFNSLPDQAAGAISVTAARANSLFVGNTKNTGNGYLTLNGATINGTANTILSNYNGSVGSTGELEVVNNVQSTAGTTMGLVLGTTTNIVQTGAGTAANAGDLVIIGSNIAEANAGSALTLLGNGNASVNGGTLELGGTNTFTGGIVAGNSAGTSGGLVQIDSSVALPTTGSLTVNANSELLLNSTGTYGTAGQSLTLSGTGTINNSGALRQSGVVTFQGNVNLATDIVITAAGASGTLTLSGTVKDNGFQLQKQGAGNLVLAGSGSMTGSTLIGNGAVTVNTGATIGTGALSLAQTSSNTTALILNSAAQTVGNLSSSFAATSGSVSQVITLNGTAFTVNETGTTTYGNNGAVNTLTSSIAGTGSLIKSGTGTLILSGNNTYSGSTTVTAGTLIVSGSTSTSNLEVGSGAALGLGGAATSGTTLSNLSLNALTLDASSNSFFYLGAGTSSDTITTSGITLNGQIQLTLVDATGGNLVAGTTYVLFNLASTGLSQAAETALLSQINTTGVSGSLSASGNDIDFTVQGVPEPGTWALLISGILVLGGLTAVRRRNVKI